MLVLSRRVGETIVIDDKWSFEITKVSGDYVKIAFSAPDEVEILRGELTAFGQIPQEPNPALAELEKLLPV